MKKYRVQLNPSGYVDVIGEPRFEYGDGELAFYESEDSDIETAYFKPDWWRGFYLVSENKESSGVVGRFFVWLSGE